MVVWKYRTIKMEFEGVIPSEYAKETTLIGEVLRKTHLDEFPQAVNIIKNDMSIVGPRPFSSTERNQLISENLNFSLRESVKPGITGLAQIQYDHENDTESAKRKLCLDSIYVLNATFNTDLQILAKTFLHVMGRKGE